MAVRGGMGIYEPIKGCDDCESGFQIDSNVKRNMREGDDEDVEMAHRVSDSTPPIPPPVRVTANVIASPTGAGVVSVKQRPTPHRQRLASLDVFRGLTVGLMILVDYAGGVMPAINHSPWDGITLADYVMPFFLFIVGVSLALTYKKLPGRVIATQKAILRAGKLLLLGLVLQGGFLHGINNLTYGVDIQQMRWMGILQSTSCSCGTTSSFARLSSMFFAKQIAKNIDKDGRKSKRIAIAYLVGALCEIWLRRDHGIKSKWSLLIKYQFQWIVLIILTTLYLGLIYGLYVPDWEYQLPSQSSSSSMKTFSVNCGVRGETRPGCNVVGMIDREILGIQHLYRRPIYGRTEECSINSPDYGPLPADAPSWCQAPFDPEGLLSSVMAVITCLVGLQYGHVLIHFEDHKDRIIRWMISSSALVLSGLVLDISGMRINKALYSFSYMCVTAGAAGILFTGIYLMVDVCRWRRPTKVLEWVGMHALMIYILAACNIVPVVLQGFYWKQPQNNILRMIGITK